MSVTTIFFRNGKMLYSRYTHKFSVGNDVALYNSLRMKPVFLTKDKYEKIEDFLIRNESEPPMEVPREIEQEVLELLKYKVLVECPEKDEKILSYVKSKLSDPEISVCYFILSEQCNLACKYCFLGNNNQEQRKKFAKDLMSKETAEKGVYFFLKQLESVEFNPNKKPVVIFYGGEPLMNFDVLEFIVEKFNSLKSDHKVLENIEYSMVSNGLLLSEYRILRLQNLGVSIAISIDGCDETSNAMRVDLNGNIVFPKIIKALDTAKKLGVPISLSITLTEETIKRQSDIIELIKKYNIKGLGFNIMMGDHRYPLPLDYNDNAAQFIIDIFKQLRVMGVYEDRIMRKLKSFAKAQVYFSDCAATSAGQIVIAADGAVGICHGCLADRKYFNSSVDDYEFDPRKNLVWQEWNHLSPIEKKECQKCEALGICGGGCPINAMSEHEGNTIHSLDERFCVHAKKTLEFFISDLHRVVTGEDCLCEKML